MEFRLLGPLEAHSQVGGGVRLGGPKQRAVLAVLLLNANQVVSKDQLVDSVWGEQPPEAVDATLQNAIYRLRRAFDEEGLIEFREPGYVLNVSPEDVDALQFERLVAAAEGLAPPERAAALRQALGLWRGAPLADLTYEGFAQHAIMRLDELRLVAQERLFDAELELGRHDVVLVEIEALAARNPTREYLRELQMLALYRAGRQRDALRVFEDTRRELIEQFGLEPSERLRALQRRILMQDETLLPTQAIRTTGSELDLFGRHAVVLLLEITGPQREMLLDEIALIVERHEGALRSGDADEIVAVFGPPRAHDDDTLRALQTAVDVRESARGRLVTRMAVERLAGTGGGPTELETVRHLLASARADELLLGAAALPLVQAAVDVIAHESGEGYRVLRFDPDAEPFPRRFDTPLVGRGTELERLQAELATVAQNGVVNRTVLIGDSGIGKTRLARELTARAAAGATTLTARCRGASDRAALLPLLEILGQLGPPERLLAGRPDTGRILAALRERSLAEASEIQWALRRLLETAATDRPLLLLIDDLHLAAPSFLDLLEYLTGWTEAPLMLLCTARPELLETRPGWTEGALVLGPLLQADAERFAAALPESADLDAEVLTAAVDAAEGNPLFLEQLVSFAADRGASSLPPTLEALIASRVDRLPSDERYVLELASVAGLYFWRSTVETLADAERATAGASLMALARRRLVRPERAFLRDEDGFRFQHALIREVVYGEMPKQMRAGLHEQVARAIDGRGRQLDEVVAYHLEQAALLYASAGEPDPALAREAARRLQLVGLRALMAVDARVAKDLLSRAIALLSDDGDARLELECQHAIAIKFTGETERADALLEDVARRSAAAGDERTEHLARIEQIYPRLSSGRATPGDAAPLIERAFRIFEQVGDDFALGRAWQCTAAIKGVFELRYGELEAAALRLRSLYEQTGYPIDVPLHLLGVAAYRGPTPVPVAIEGCRRLLGEVSTPMFESFILPFLAAVEAMAGRFDEAREHLQEARHARHEYPDAETSLATSWAALSAEVELLAAEPERAEAVLAPACKVLRGVGETEWLATNTAFLAEAQYRQGRHAEALATSETALAIGPPEHLTSRSVARRVRAKSLARVGRLAEAQAAAAEAIAGIAATDVLDEQGETFVAAAEVHRRSGNDAEADAASERALERFEQKGNVVSAGRVRATLRAS
jgi:DNA-binding SARP family transcriptional activator